MAIKRKLDSKKVGRSFIEGFLLLIRPRRRMGWGIYQVWHFW